MATRSARAKAEEVVRKQVDQLDLFAPRPRPAPRLEQPRGDLVLQAPSPTTGGGLCAIEAVRVLKGLSIAPAGILIKSPDSGFEEARCLDCSRYMCGYIGIPLYAPVSRFGDEPGESFTCGRCGCAFCAHRNERRAS